MTILTQTITPNRLQIIAYVLAAFAYFVVLIRLEASCFCP
ncbi:hypothetical protein GMJLKIPL_5700 [Methylobacterium isbiliense]|jgi:hypothetical protein|uniref:Uncharacterized protein n=1 Tax=Methylobacterium isbiliense TaxID=315478 RepID=A0ABQ4SPD9_9HYPH|nr:hypothetical protein GMJLKIPL_5700 [Methylobacterium isbiliense]